VRDDDAKIKSLPPLNALRTFEVAGRRLSFARAANELRVTPSAVSRQVRTLEEALGLELFRRGNRTLALTPAGKHYLVVVQQAFASIVKGTEELSKSAADRIIRVNALPSFASNWLVPRLPLFLEEHPGYDVALETSVENVDFDTANVDAAVRFGSGPWAGLSSHRLFELDAFPVCSPRLLKHTPLNTAEELANHALIHVTFLPALWKSWLVAAGASHIQSKRHHYFDNAELAFQAAETGMGVALGVYPLCGERLRQGRLVSPLCTRLRIRETYNLVHRSTDDASRKIVRFRTWLLKTAAK